MYVATNASSVDIFNINTQNKIESIKLPKIHDFTGDIIESKIYSVDILNDNILILSQGEKGGRSIDTYKNGKLEKIIDDKDGLFIAKAKYLDENHIIYALLSNDYKASIAYSSCENVGIIFLGLGGAFYGLGAHEPFIALLGFIAALFHILNHAIFKSLLFMLSGNIYTATRTRNMDSLGGLHKKMPITSILFFIAALSICALPPLNGFASEWMVYRTMVMGGIAEGVSPRFFFALAIIALSITGAMAIMAFSKAYGSI